jgi:hypothetical protein
LKLDSDRKKVTVRAQDADLPAITREIVVDSTKFVLHITKSSNIRIVPAGRTESSLVRQ